MLIRNPAREAFHILFFSVSATLEGNYSIHECEKPIYLTRIAFCVVTSGSYCLLRHTEIDWVSWCLVGDTENKGLPEVDCNVQKRQAWCCNKEYVPFDQSRCSCYINYAIEFLDCPVFWGFVQLWTDSLLAILATAMNFSYTVLKPSSIMQSVCDALLSRLEREKRLNLCRVHALLCYVESSYRHSNCSCLCAVGTDRLCQYRGSFTGIWQACVSRQRPCSCHMNTFSVHTESFIQWNKWGKICTRALRSTLCVLIGFYLFDLSGSFRSLLTCDEKDRSSLGKVLE